MPFELTKKDPSQSGYLRIKLFLLQTCLTAGKKLQSWYLDSGCSHHMTGERCMFQSLLPKTGGTVTFGGNQKGMIAGVGKIGIPPYPCIDKVLYVKGLKHNLLSISQLCDSGYDVAFNKGECTIRNSDGSPLFTAKKQGNLYKIKLGELSSQNVLCLVSV